MPVGVSDQSAEGFQPTNSLKRPGINFLEREKPFGGVGPRMESPDKLQVERVKGDQSLAPPGRSPAGGLNPAGGRRPVEALHFKK